MGVTIEEASKHIVVVTFTGDSSDEEIERYLSSMTTEILGRPERTVTILDASAGSRPSVAHGRLQMRWLDVHHDELRRFSLGTAFVVPSLLARSALRAIFWLKPMSQPHVVCKTLEEALRWADERVRIAFPLTG